LIKEACSRSGWLPVWTEFGCQFTNSFTERNPRPVKSDAEICEILNAYDLTHSVWSAAELVGCHPRTVKRYVRLRDGGVARQT
jgi:hypothetical protein